MQTYIFEVLLLSGMWTVWCEAFIAVLFRMLLLAISIAQYGTGVLIVIQH